MTPTHPRGDGVDLAAIDHQLDEARATCRVVIECSKGSRTKYTWDHEISAFELSGMLPAGMSFPLDFGMVPSTLADDGDPIDILVIGDEPAIVGCVVDVRILGVIKANQTERGCTYRNDRLVGRIALAVSYEHAEHIDDLGAPFVDHVGRWFTNYNALKNKGFDVLEVGDASEAVRLIAAASDVYAARRPKR